MAKHPSPIDLPTKHTVEFIQSRVVPGAEIIEIGCGEGHVAAALKSCGYKVVALDSEEQMVSKTREKGVNAFHASWPAFDCEPVDALVFTRSLHHIHDLTAAVSKVRSTLRPAGVLLVEDFAFDEVSSAAIDWLLELLRSSSARVLVKPHPDAFVTELLTAKNAMRAWQQNHDHELHSANTMLRTIRHEFSLKEITQVPYMYRYLVPVLPETRAGVAFIDAAFQQEKALAEQGAFAAIGRRIVAHKD